MAKAITESPDQPKPVFKKESFKEAIKIFEYIKPYKWSLIIGLILLSFTTGFFMVFPYLSGLMIDVAQGSAETDLTLGSIGWILALTLIIQGFLAYARVMLFAQVSEKGIADVRKAVYD